MPSNVLEIELSTGDINVDSITVGQADLTTTTGEITVGNVTAKNDIDVKTDTGKVKLTNVSCADFMPESDTGTITLKNVVATGSFSVESNTGDVRFENSDAAQISVKTSTGNVTGTLLSEKVFITEKVTDRRQWFDLSIGGASELCLCKDILPIVCAMASISAIQEKYYMVRWREIV